MNDALQPEEVRHMPPAPGKEMPFLVINFFSFPNEDVARDYERNMRKWYPEVILFSGRMSGEISEKYTHCLVWLYKDFDEYKRSIEDYAPTLDQSSKAEGDLPFYQFEHAYMCRVADDRDPILIEQGIEGWTKRLHEVWGKPTVPNPERVNAWRESLYARLTADWDADAFVRSGWLPARGSEVARDPM